jgi:hypothetical protein
MRAASIEMAQTKFFENPPRVAPPESDDVIQAFTPDTAKESFANRIGRDSRMQMMGMVRRKPFA